MPILGLFEHCSVQIIGQCSVLKKSIEFYKNQPQFPHFFFKKAKRNGILLLSLSKWQDD